MGLKESVPVGQVVSNERVCKICEKSLEEKFFYKYELKEEQPTCKACKKESRKKGKKDKDIVNLREKKVSGLYVVSTVEKMEENIFKVGKHTGTQRKLISRYRTYFIDPVILFYVPSDNINELEKTVLYKLQQFRISDLDGGETEWVKLSFADLINIILDTYCSLK